MVIFLYFLTLYLKTLVQALHVSSRVHIIGHFITGEWSKEFIPINTSTWLYTHNTAGVNGCVDCKSSIAVRVNHLSDSITDSKRWVLRMVYLLPNEAVRQQVLTWTNVEPDLCCHMRLPSHSALTTEKTRQSASYIHQKVQCWIWTRTSYYWVYLTLNNNEQLYLLIWHHVSILLGTILQESPVLK